MLSVPPRLWLHAKSSPAGIGDIHYMGALAVPRPAILSRFVLTNAEGAPRPHVPCSRGPNTITLPPRMRATWAPCDRTLGLSSATPHRPKTIFSLKVCRAAEKRLLL